jgi:hypothetical protein
VEQLGVAAPILPGQMERWRSMVDELRRRADEHRASMKDKGLEREDVWLQETPHGSTVILYLEGDDPASYMGKVFQSDSDFDHWFAGELAAIHGVDPNQPPPRMERIDLFP